MTHFTALFDACVLYPAELRSLLMYLALTDLFRARWTDRIHDEWMNGVLKDRLDLTWDKLFRVRNLMNANVRDVLVTDFEDLIPSLTLPDPNDRHVLAAAIRGRADVIVTKNLRDFPARCLADYGVEAQHPDAFIRHLLDLDVEAVCKAVQSHRRSLKNPPFTVDGYLALLEAIRIPNALQATTCNQVPQTAISFMHCDSQMS